MMDQDLLGLRSAGSTSWAALSRGPTRVLLAEDDPALRRQFATLLSDHGYDVIEAVDGAHLVHLFRAAFHWRVCEPPDVIIVPDDMRGFGGFDVLSALRTLGRATPVVLTFDRTDPRRRERARAAGAAAILARPVDPDRLPGFVRAVTRH
jgi:two-component system chemotaxis response regulator CheY